MITEERILSISNSLCSSSRKSGPKLFNKVLNKTIGINNSNSDFSEKVIEVYYNLKVPEYYEHSLKNKDTKISSSGALISYSGKKTGRSPKDKRIVDSKYNEHIWYD